MHAFWVEQLNLFEASSTRPIFPFPVTTRHWILYILVRTGSARSAGRCSRYLFSITFFQSFRSNLFLPLCSMGLSYP
jgi:hypothetical protein